MNLFNFISYIKYYYNQKLPITKYLFSFFQQKTLHDYCYFYETLENGWFQFRSSIDQTKKLGFTKKGKPIPSRQNPQRDTQCINFQKKKVTERDHPNYGTPKPHPIQPPAPLPNTHIRHKHHHDMVTHQQKLRQHQLQLLSEERQKYAQSHIPQPHGHHVSNVTLDSITQPGEQSRPARPPGRRGLHKTKKHRLSGGGSGGGAGGNVGGKLIDRLGMPKQRPLADHGARLYEMMANDEPSMRPEDLPNMLDYSSNDEYSKFRPRPIYFDKRPAEHQLREDKPTIKSSHDETQSLTHKQHNLDEPQAVNSKNSDEPISVPKQMSKDHHHSVTTGTKGHFPKSRNNNKRPHAAWKKTFDKISNSNLNSNS